MTKNKKKLQDLEIESFVFGLNADEKLALAGGQYTGPAIYTDIGYSGCSPQGPNPAGPTSYTGCMQTNSGCATRTTACPTNNSNCPTNNSYCPTPTSSGCGGGGSGGGGDTGNYGASTSFLECV